MPAHRTPWLIFLAQLAKETSSKKLAAAAAAASLCLSELQAAAPNRPLRCSCQGDVHVFGIKPFISGFTFLRQPVRTPQEPDHKGFKRNGHLKEERKKKKSILLPCAAPVCSAQPVSSSLFPKIPGVSSQAINSCQVQGKAPPAKHREPHSNFPNFWLCSSGPALKWKPRGEGSASHHRFLHADGSLQIHSSRPINTEAGSHGDTLSTPWRGGSLTADRFSPSVKQD